MKARRVRDEDQDALQRLLRALSRDAGFTVRVEDLVQRWMKFVGQVEDGYNDSIYEYANDLAVRDVIEKILTDSSREFSNRLLAEVNPLDRRFLDATRQVSRPVRRQHERALSPFWYRVPINLEPELYTDLQSEGIIE